MVLNFAGIRRKSEFSPNHVVNDLRIIQLTAEALQSLGATVTMYDEGGFEADAVKERFIFSMAQGPTGTSVLHEIERRGAFIINSPRGVMNCYRVNMVQRLAGCGIPFPASVVVDAASQANAILASMPSQKVWLKRGDVHAVHKEDVTLVYSADQAFTMLSEFAQRGIKQAVLQEHLEGDTVKFYAVRETPFFHWYYLNGVHRTSFAIDRLRSLANASAEVLDLYIYGGDAIIDRDGKITIIDINDWPSFAVVREQASHEIATLIHRKALEYDQQRD
jgi:glutathione synthase/RimK-type ligase-like ATP-grasp enzyme